MQGTHSEQEPIGTGTTWASCLGAGVGVGIRSRQGFEGCQGRGCGDGCR